MMSQVEDEQQTQIHRHYWQRERQREGDRHQPAAGH
jgi:hypothetical protein